MDPKDQPVATLRWVPVLAYGDSRPHCETERHAGMRILSEWVACLLPMRPGERWAPKPRTWALCQGCMAQIAADLGTTPEAGQYKGTLT